MKRFLENLLEEKAPGPNPSFSVLHIIKALELVSQTQNLGRGKLSEELEIGEGATRTLIERLKSANLFSVSRKGCFLTARGEKVWGEFESTFPRKIRLDRNKLTSSECNIAVHVSGGGNRVRAGMEQRDAAIIAGARGAITLVFRKRRLFIPTINQDLSRNFPDVSVRITALFKLKENDAVVIGYADGWTKAEYGALAAAWTLVDSNGVQ